MSVPKPIPLAWPPPDVAISASLLAADPLHLLAEARIAEKAGVDWLHIDVMDGHFVPNLGLSVATARALVAHQRLPVEVHLMVAQPKNYCAELAAAGVSIITVHLEAVAHLDAQVTALRALGVRVGVAINPTTPVSLLEDILPEIDLVLLMTVNPGFGGQRFIPRMIDKLRRLRLMRDRIAPGCVIEVDGGITPTWAQACGEHGAAVLVAGSAIFAKKDRIQATGELRQAALLGLNPP